MLRIPCILVDLPIKQWINAKQYIFKRRVMFEPQKLLHFSRALVQVASQLVACKKMHIRRYQHDDKNVFEDHTDRKYFLH